MNRFKSHYNNLILNPKYYWKPMKLKEKTLVKYDKTLES